MGLSPRNLWDMKKFYLRYNECDTKLRQAVSVLPWGHNLLLMSYDLSPEHVVFYANEVVAKGWSRDMLRHALKSEYHLSIQVVEKSNRTIKVKNGYRIQQRAKASFNSFKPRVSLLSISRTIVIPKELPAPLKITCKTHSFFGESECRKRLR